MAVDRRELLKMAGLTALASSIPKLAVATDSQLSSTTPPDYTIRIGTGLVELAPDHIVSTTLYNGQFPGPLLRFQEGQQVVVDVQNDTDTPELVHWHGQMIPSDVDGAAEEGTPFVPAHGMRRIAFVPKPSGFRFYHTHVVAGGDLNRGTYTGQAGPVYIEPKNDPGAYDREIFLVLKEFAPAFSRGGDMAMDVLAGAPLEALQEMGQGRGRGSAGEDQGLRSRLRAVRHQWPDARSRRTDPRQAGRAGAVPRAQRERHRDPQPGSARPCFQGCRARRQSRADAGGRARALARHRRAHLRASSI